MTDRETRLEAIRVKLDTAIDMQLLLYVHDAIDMVEAMIAEEHAAAKEARLEADKVTDDMISKAIIQGGLSPEDWQAVNPIGRHALHPGDKKPTVIARVGTAWPELAKGRIVDLEEKLRSMTAERDALRAQIDSVKLTEVHHLRDELTQLKLERDALLYRVFELKAKLEADRELVPLAERLKLWPDPDPTTPTIAPEPPADEFSIDFAPNDSGTLDAAFENPPPWLELTIRSHEVVIRRAK